jgi:hypothetical protein
MTDPYTPPPTEQIEQVHTLEPAKITAPALTSKPRMPDHRRIYHQLNQRLMMIRAPFIGFSGYGIFTDQPIHHHRQIMRQWIGDNLEKQFEQDRQKGRHKERDE